MSTLAAEKPVVSEPTKATETPAVPAATTEPTTTATTEPAAHATTAEPTTTEPTIEAAKPTETTTAAAPTTAAETTEPKVADKKVVEPIYTGALGYKAPGLIKLVTDVVHIKVTTADNFLGASSSRRSTSGSARRNLSTMTSSAATSVARSPRLHITPPHGQARPARVYFTLPSMPTASQVLLAS